MASPSSGKRYLALAALWFWGLLAGPALAAPTGGVVTSGTAAISQSGNTTNINQSTNKASINWQTFSIKPAETVNFNQPSVYAITLNRVVGNESSLIQGALNATGRVFLLNSNGVLFTKGSSVNTSGFLASTLNLTDANFNAGNYVFNANGSLGSVVNQGTITANNGGYVALLGNTVSNQGVIAATKGTVVLASGDMITLNFNGNSLLNVTIDQGTLNALVENKQAIYADGGTVILTAKAADDLLSAQVNNSGLIQARTIDDLKGDIKLLAQGGTVNVAGTLDASAPNGGDGGLIETSGNKVSIADSAVITTAAPYGKAGTWVIDPDGFTIGINSGDGDMAAATLSNALISGNVTIASTSGSGTDGNINVNGPVSWSANTLTLNATNNIYVNNTMTATGAASFAANYGYLLNNGVPTTTASGTGNADGTPYGLYTYLGGTNGSYVGKINFSGTGSVTLNGTPYTVINAALTSTTSGVTTYGLDYARSNPSGNYVLGSDFGGLTASTWTSAIGSASTPFSGNFNGFGHRITSPTLTASGLFGTIGTGAVVSNLGIYTPTESAGSTNQAAVGVLANVNYGSVINSFVSSGTFTVRSSSYPTVTVNYAGGLVGDNYGLIAQSYAMTNLVGVTSAAGGLVGINEAGGTILDSSARATTQYVANYSGASPTYVGGFAGVNNGAISRSYSANKLTLTDTTSIDGGFVGNNTGAIDQCYSYAGSSSNYSTGPYLGGFVGNNSGTITNAYTTSLYSTSASAKWDAGFAYQNSGTITNAYATSYSGNTLNTARYGFVANNTNPTGITNAYWYSNVATGDTAVTDGSAASSLTSTQAATYSSYSFSGSAWAASMSGYPILKNLPVYVNTSTILIPTYGSATATGSTLYLTTLGLQGGGGTSSMIDSIVSATYNPFTVVTDNGYVDAGVQAASRVLSSGYSNVKGTVTVNPKALTISAGLVADKTYDGSTSATLTGTPTISGLVGSQTLNITYTSAAFAQKDAGTGLTANLTYTATNGTNGGKVSNYTVPTTTTANITPKTITANITASNKTYDGTTTDTVSSYALVGVVSGDSLTLNYTSAAFADKNTGAGKTVTVSGISLSGTPTTVSDYAIASTATTTAAINPLVLTLYGTKASNDGNTTVPASNISATNLIVGDTVTLGGSVTIAATTTGVQPIASVSGLTVNNPNYTVTGATGSVVIGSQSLALDHVASGTVTINTSGNTTTVNQTTGSAVIDWFRFNIAANEAVNFVQPSSTSVVLNRVTGSEQSVINGILTATGRVFLINSNGILFGAGSSVNAGALLASTLNITDSNFLANNYAFTVAWGNGSVVSQGDIIIANGGFAALMSNNGVTQTGSLTAQGGKALLASADHITLTLDSADSGLSSYAISSLDGATTVGGFLNVLSTGATGGLIEMAGNTVSTMSNLSLVTGANGTWSWTQYAPITIGTNGNFSADFVNSNLALRSFSLTTQGGDLTVNSPLSWSTNSTLTLGASNNININAPITATGTNAGFAMNYGGNYNILTPASFSGTVLNSAGILVAQTDTSGGVYGSITLPGSNASLKINGATYTLIQSMSGVAAMGTGNYALAQNLDASGTTYTAPVASTVNGTFTGLGHTISNLTISNTAAQDLALIGTTTAVSTIRDIGLLNVNINAGASNYAGALVGSNLANVSNAYSSGTVTGNNSGGLIGYNGVYPNPGVFNAISNCFSNVAVTGSGVGGLIGRTEYLNLYSSHAAGNINVTGGMSGGLIGYASNTNVYNSYATGSVTGGVSSYDLGGLIGNVAIGAGPLIIQNSYATGSVTGGYSLGGLVGTIASTLASFTINNSYATGNVTSLLNQEVTTIPGIGGLVGDTTSGGTATTTIYITNSYATGNVAYTTNYGIGAGGLVGYMQYSSVITNSYATGNVTGSTGEASVGGLVGTGSATNITNSYATGNVTGYLTVGGLAGGNSGIITNSWASGNVIGTNTPGSYTAGNNIGGLVGTNTGTGTIIGSWATGSVTSQGATASTGGLVGTNAGYITNSWAGGYVSGPSGLTGGIAGVSFNNSGNPNSPTAGSINDSYYNSEINSGTPITNNYQSLTPGHVTGGGGLTNEQMPDVQYYLNGTIVQVLAGRAAEAAFAAQQAAFQAQQEAIFEDSGQQTGGQASFSGQGSNSTGQVLNNQISSFTPTNTGTVNGTMDNHIVYSDSGSYSATIKSITADGVQFDMEGGSQGGGGAVGGGSGPNK